MTLSCYWCPQEFASLDEYTGHLRNRHAVLEPCSILCNVEDVNVHLVHTKYCDSIFEKYIQT
jgi:hypothetical protein